MLRTTKLGCLIQMFNEDKFDHFRGIEAVVIDYVRPIIFGNTIPKIAVGLMYVLSIATLAGLMNFIFNDVGIANGIQLLWKL